MKRCLSFTLQILFVIAAAAQTEKFDIASFVSPPGWQRIDSNGVVAFMDSKTTNGQTSFCQIILYPSRASSGNAGKDFKTEWNNRVAVPAKATKKPVTQSNKTPEGWNVTTGHANITQFGMTYACMLVTATGFGKTMSVMVNTAGGEYAATIEKFFNDLDLDSKATVTNIKNRQNNADKNQTNMSGNITLKNYDFIAPEGWQVQNNKDHLLAQNMESGCLIRILEPQPSSGDLEQDTKAVFETMYAGWKYQKTGEQQYALSKGFLPKGLEYCMMEAGMSKLSADGSRYDGFEDGAALIIKAGAQIVIISVRHNSSLLAHGDCLRKYETWRRFFNSFTVQGATVAKNEEDPTKRIIGSWSMSESGASGEYVFAANGNYALYGAIGTSSTSRDYNYEYLHIKTYSFQGDGSYSINDNQLKLTKRSSNNTEQVQFRFEKVNHGGTGWKERLYLLTKSQIGQYEVCYEKKDR